MQVYPQLEIQPAKDGKPSIDLATFASEVSVEWGAYNTDCKRLRSDREEKKCGWDQPLL